MPNGFETNRNLQRFVDCLSSVETAQKLGGTLDFVCRYFNVNNQTKNLTPSEAAALAQGNVRIVSTWENGYPTSVNYFTRDRGNYDGYHAHAMAKQFGQPSETPIYFAVDYDARTAADQQAVLAYLAGVLEGFQNFAAEGVADGDVIPDYAVGVYGCGCVLDWCRDANVATYYWQAHAPAWCGNDRVWAGASIRQFGALNVCQGLSVDRCTANENYGGWLAAAPADG